MSALRPFGPDELGLRRAMADRILPMLVAAMAFLAALALAGWFGSAALAQHWRLGAGASLTVQVPQPSDPAAHGDPTQAAALAPIASITPMGPITPVADQKGVGQTRLAVVVGLLADTPGVASVHALSEQELTDLLKPWLAPGVGRQVSRLAIPLPAVIAVRLTAAAGDLAPLSHRLAEAAPGTLVEDHGVWISRLGVLARSLQACAGLALVLVAGVGVAVVAVATRAGLSTRREAIEIVHGLGATDRYIASRFAARATLLAAVGGAGGALAALPVLLALAWIAAPFAGGGGSARGTIADILESLPDSLWLALPCLPIAAAAIGFATTHAAVRRWLRRLP